MIYFDNAATTYPKPNAVLRGVMRCISRYCANAGRSGHRLSVATSEKIFETRQKIASHIGAESADKIVFTENATHALNIAIMGMVADGGHVIISELEHNSVLRPVSMLTRERGVSMSVFKTDGDIRESIRELIKSNTCAVISTLASNVNGKTVDIKALSEVSRECGVKLILDASQYIGHHGIDLSRTPCDALCAPAHKALFGIQGAGILYIKNGEAAAPLMYGGSGNESKSLEMPTLPPERFEAGTLPSPSVISMLYGVEFIEGVGLSLIASQNRVLCDTAHEMLNKIPDCDIYGAENGIVAFNIKEIPAYVISDELDKHGIAVRGGLHCAPLAHRSIGTPKGGCVRISFSYFNRLCELDRFYKAMKDIRKKYKA